MIYSAISIVTNNFTIVREFTCPLVFLGGQQVRDGAAGYVCDVPARQGLNVVLCIQFQRIRLGQRMSGMNVRDPDKVDAHFERESVLTHQILDHFGQNMFLRLGSPACWKGRQVSGDLRWWITRTRIVLSKVLLGGI